MAPFSKIFGGTSSSSSSSSSSSGAASSGAPLPPPPSPFFQPSTPFQVKVIQTPGGSHHTQKVRKTSSSSQHTGGSSCDDDEHKSTLLGCVANLSNAIVGSGIVGIPFAIQQAGFCTGLILVALCAVLTEKSLRMLIETAKHVQVPTYETLCEAVFGHAGFYFISINMFFLAYGAMMSYLMIVKDTFGQILGMETVLQRRALLFCISLLVIVPLSSLRDMADLAQTSRFNVLFDITMVLIVVYVAPMSDTVQEHGGVWPIVSNSMVPHWNTVFVGLGVLSFAFVCQHSAFIIAGSLQQPTRRRWQWVTRCALTFCACLAMLCGTCGYLGYLDHTQGNILNNLQSNHVLSNLARGLLGTTMLFVYPMESFVARHVCVVLLFQGRRAHEGEDSAILSRRDRRITLTVSLYLMALIPATVFENLGNVLAATGAVGGSCISYIGVGAVYLGVYGAEFIQLVQPWKQSVEDMKHSMVVKRNIRNDGGGNTTGNTNSSQPAIRHNEQEEEEEEEVETTPLKPSSKIGSSTSSSSSSSWYMLIWKTLAWYLAGMPLWYWMATLGKANLTLHRQEMAGKSPHLSRIDSRVGQQQPQKKHPQHPSRRGPQRRQGSTMGDIQEEDYDDLQERGLAAAAAAARGGIRDADGLTTLHSSLRGMTHVGGGKIVVRSDSDFIPGHSTSSGGTILPPKSGVLTAATSSSYQQRQQQQQPSQQASVTTPKQQQQQQQSTTATTTGKSIVAAGEDAEHHDPAPTCIDFIIAIGYMLFGVVALTAGLLSLFVAQSSSSSSSG